MSSVMFGVLGPVEVRIEGRLVALGAGKPTVVLAALLLQANEVVARERLVEAVWGEGAPATAVNTLQVYVSQLRKQLRAAVPDRELISTRASGYVLELEPDELDVWQFDRLLEAGVEALGGGDVQAARERLASCLSLWRGRPYEDVAYEVFAQSEIARLEELRLVAIERRVEADLQLGRDHQLIGELEQLVVEFPLRERLRALLMLALYRAGRQADALQHYRTGRELLLEELGLEPGPELRDLQAAILNHDPSLKLSSTPPTEQVVLPKPPTRLIGRQEEIAHVIALLEEEDTRLITVTGPGGVGKTRLAIEAARRAADRFDAGVAFVALAPIADPALVVPMIAQTLGVREAPDAPLDERLARTLKGRRGLVVLDNFEHVTAASAAVAGLLRTVPDVTILATSREPLHLAGEREFPVPLLELPDPEDADAASLMEFDTIKLFVDRARSVDPHFRISEENAQAVAEICRALDGLPLAIELAAARVRMLPPHALLSRLRQRVEILTAGTRDVPDRQRTLRATIDWSYRLLSAPEQRLLARLTVFSGGWTLEAAEAVCDIDDDLGVDVFSGLCSLVEKNLVRRTRRDEARFSMLATIRDYAEDLLEHDAERARVRMGHAEYFAALARAVELEAFDSSHIAERLAPDIDNMRAAAALALTAQPPDLALHLATYLGGVCKERGLVSESARWLDAALGLEGRASAEPRSRAVALRAEIHRVSGEYAASRRLLTEAETLALEADSELAVIEVKNIEALLAFTTCDFETAADASSCCLALCLKHGWSPAIDQLIIGQALLGQGDTAGAIRMLTDARHAARQGGLDMTESGALSSLARAAAQDAAWAEARRLHTEALANPRLSENPPSLWFCVDDLAPTLAQAGEAEAAARLWGAAARLRDDAGAVETPFDLALRESALAQAKAKLGEARFDAAWADGQRLTPEQARRYALEAIEMLPSA